MIVHPPQRVPATRGKDRVPLGHIIILHLHYHVEIPGLGNAMLTETTGAEILLTSMSTPETEIGIAHSSTMTMTTVWAGSDSEMISLGMIAVAGKEERIVRASQVESDTIKQ